METHDQATERLLLLPATDDAAVAIEEAGEAALVPKFASAPARRSLEISRTQFYRIGRSFAASFALEADRGAVFLLAPVMFCIGGLAYFALPFEADWPVVLAITAVAAIVAGYVRHREMLGVVSLAAAFVSIGLLSAKIETWRSATRVIGGEITTFVTGRVELVEPRENGRVRLTLRILKTERPKLRYSPDRVRLTARSAPSDVRPGMVISGVARLTQPLGPLRPGGYDFAFENYFDGIGATGFFLRGPTIDQQHYAEPGLFERASYEIEIIRNSLADRVRSRIGGGEGEIAAALIAGVRVGIPEETNEILRVTGLAHVLSISGLHMALVAGVVIGGMRFAFALFPAFSSKYPVRKFAAAGALIAVTIYLMISGAAIAAQRSFLMVAIMLVALLFDRAALTMRNLAIAALVILAVSPHEAAGPSFQMSFAATAALIAAYGWWQQRNRYSGGAPKGQQTAVARSFRTIALYATGLVATALIAGSATGIFGAWHFQRVSPLGIPANLLTMPIVSVLVMPFAVLGVLLVPFGLDGPVFWAMGKGLEWMIGIAGWLAAMTPIDAIGAIPLSAVVLLSAALVPLTLATTPVWRAVALPLVVLGGLLLLMRDLPLAFASENGRLVGIRLPDGQIAVNRKRPSSFIIKDWQRAMMGAPVVKPVEVADDDMLFSRTGSFNCRDGLCVSRQQALTLAHARDMPRAGTACGKVDVIIIEDPTAANPCPFASTRVVTAKTLALRGSAEMGRAGEIAFALPENARVWHDHRRFSRAARGMGPYVSKQKQVSNMAAPSGERPSVTELPDEANTDNQ